MLCGEMMVAAAATPAKAAEDPAIITDGIAEFLDRQRLGYVATVSPDGRPNVSPKGTITRWDDSSLIFADIRSPDTVRNLKGNHSIEISVVDPVLRRGYLFEGTGTIIRDPVMLERALTLYRRMGVRSTINSVVVVEVSSVSSVLSPLYDLGMTEDEIGSKWGARLARGP